MRLKKLSLKRGSGYDWDTDKGISGEIEFYNESGVEVKFPINEEQGKAIVELVAEQLVESAKAVGATMLDDIFRTVDGAKAIEDKTSGDE